MLYGRLLFEDDDVQTLVTKISRMSAFFLLASYPGAHFFRA